MERILLVEDDSAIYQPLTSFLRGEGFAVRQASGQREALALLETEEFDLVLLDVGLRDGNGFSVCSAVKQRGGTAVIFLSASGDEYSVVTGLDLGADDYIAKPFSQRLLIARIRAILRRAEVSQGGSGTEEPAAETSLVRGRLAMDTARHRVTWAGVAVTLTVTEFLILETLAQRPGIVKTRNQLMDAAYHDDIYVDDRTIDSHIKRVRRKFRQVDATFDAIETLYGAGYRFSEE